MNKRLPLLLTVLALVLLAASLAYWFLQLYKPAQRPLAPAPAVVQAEPSPDAAATLFGGQPAAVAISSYQLTGVVAAGRDSAVILVAEGSPPKAVRIGREIVPGVTVAEVHPRYVMLSEGGIMKRVDIAADTRPSGQGNPNLPQAPQGPQPVGMAPTVEPQTTLGVVRGPPELAAPPTNLQPAPTNPIPEPPMDQGAADQGAQQQAQPVQQGQQGQQVPPPPNQVQMPPPTRAVQPSQVQ